MEGLTFPIALDYYRGFMTSHLTQVQQITASINQGHNRRDGGDYGDASRIHIIVVHAPHQNAKHLEDVEGMKDLREDHGARPW